MRRVAQALQRTEPGFPVLLPAMPALLVVVLVQSWVFVVLTLKFPPGLDACTDAFRQDCWLGMAVATAGTAWAWLRGRLRVAGWTGTGLVLACYGLFARVALHASLLTFPHGAVMPPEVRAEPVLRHTDAIGGLAVVLGLLLVVTACIVDVRERRTMARSVSR